MVLHMIQWLYMYVASVCSKCLVCFSDVYCKCVYLDVVYVSHMCCKGFKSGWLNTNLFHANIKARQIKIWVYQYHDKPIFWQDNQCWYSVCYQRERKQLSCQNFEGIANVLAPNQLHAKSFELAHVLAWQTIASTKHALYLDVCKSRSGVSYVAMAIHIYCKCMFQIF